MGFLNVLLAPNVLLLNSHFTTDQLTLIMKIESKQAKCPSCHNSSHRKHSRYMRQLKDLPLGDREVQLFLCSNKWFCDDPNCAVKVFTERLNWIDPYRRRTRRLEDQLTTLAFSTSCLQAEKLCKLFHISVSHDALLDLIYRKKAETRDSLSLSSVWMILLFVKGTPMMS